jgi:hypothetical protein
MTATLAPTTALRAPDPAPTSLRRRLALLVGVPIAWAIVLLFHPTGDGTEVFPVVDGQLGAWMVVHLTMVAFIPLLAMAVHHLVRDLHDLPARITRWALPVFVSVYGAYEALMGVGNGILVATSDDLGTAARAEVVQSFSESSVIARLENVGSLAWGIALVSAAFALQRAHRIRAGSVVALIVAAPLIAMHAPPFGTIGLLLFVAAIRPCLRPGRAGEPQ